MDFFGSNFNYTEYHRRMMEEFIERRKRRKGFSSYQPFEDHYSSGPYGKIYGRNPRDWTYTKPKQRSLDFNKLKWKPQYTLEEVIIIDRRQIAAKDTLLIAVQNLFMIELSFSDIPMIYHNRSFNKNIDALNVTAFILYCIEYNRIPLPVEELA